MDVAKRRTPPDELLGASMVIAGIGGGVILVVASIIAFTMGDRWWVVGFPAATTPLILFARYGEGLFQALGHVRAINLITLARVLLPLLLITPPLVMGASDKTAIGIWSLWLVILPVLMYPSLRRTLGGRRPPSDPTIYRRLVGAGMKLSVANTALMTGPRIALIALAVFAGDVAVGVYSVAIAAGDVVYLFSYTVVSSAFAGIGQRPREESIALTARSVRHTILLAFGVGGMLVPVVAIGLGFVVGPGYGDVPWLLAILLPGILGLSSFWVFHTFFTVQMGSPATVTRIALLSMGTNVVLCLILVPPLGLWGAAIATTIANTVSATASFTRFRATCGVPFRALIPGLAELRDYVGLGRSLLGRVRS
jgi:O-antigen/teichoic acid export membrane protein